MPHEARPTTALGDGVKSETRTVTQLFGLGARSIVPLYRRSWLWE